MKLIVCLETLPDPDCMVTTNGNFDFEKCSIRLDSYSAIALEFALHLKDVASVPVHAVLLDSFELKSAYEEIQAVGADTIDWVKVPFTFDPFRRAELFSEAVNPEEGDVIIAGYHCETCCTNSIPMLISLNMGLPYYPEIGDIHITDNGLVLSEFKTNRELAVGSSSVVVSIRSSRKLRYPSFRERLACREADDHSSPRSMGGAYEGDAEQHLKRSAEVIHPSSIKGDQREQSSSLIDLMDERGMFQL